MNKNQETIDPKVIFVGERQSPTAKEKGWTWQTCQTESPRLCAIQLFSALQEAGLNPAAQIFVNLFTFEGDLEPLILAELKQLSTQGTRIIAMGRKVEKVLTEQEIDNTYMVHPAARGKIRNPKEYTAHVKKVLTLKTLDYQKLDSD